MRYKRTTYVPNELFDVYLKELSFSELKILLYIIRQTYGWKLKNGRRKQRDRISHSQFQKKTGLSRRVVSDVIQSLITKHLITVTDYHGNKLHSSLQRKGKVCIYYAPRFQSCANNSTRVCKQKHLPVQNKAHNKTNNTKQKGQKDFQQKEWISDSERLQQILRYKETKK